MKILIFGLDGNVLDNYSVKAKCAGEALRKNVAIFLGIKKGIDYFSKVYIETSGMNSIEQFKIAFKRIRNVSIPIAILKKTEKDFRNCLKFTEKKIKMFGDVKKFLTNNRDKYIFVITTTVPVEDVSRLAARTGIKKHFDVICARHGVWLKGEKIIRVDKMDKGKKHFNFLRKKIKAAKKDMIAVSSTRQDIINAKENKIVSVAVEHIFSQKRLKEFKPDYIIKDFTKLASLLERIN